MKYIWGLILSMNLLIANDVMAKDALASIYKNVILQHSQEAVSTAQNLKTSILKSDINASKARFGALITAWKKVEGFYILGDLNDDYLDSPRYIDIFHQGKEDIRVQLDLVLSSKEEVQYALYKNSHKTINALEYILFAQDLKTPRVQSIALAIIHKILVNIQEIHRGYLAEQKTFMADEVTSNAMMLNALIENSYKMKEWRVGDPAGLSRKFKGDADNSRGEYSLSANSMVAIQAILTTHQAVLSSQVYSNFGTMIEGYGVKEELASAQKYLALALQNSQNVKDEDFSTAKPLYSSLKKLHTTYYITLIGKLKITAKILDADGD
ncbi:MAG: imelysin family protein [Sulfurovum sp.]|nr:imelysin family protein [Sulfurovum sp.]